MALSLRNYSTRFLRLPIELLSARLAASELRGARSHKNRLATTGTGLERSLLIYLLDLPLQSHNFCHQALVFRPKALNLRDRHEVFAVTVFSLQM